MSDEAREALARLLSAIRVGEPETDWDTAGQTDYADADVVLASDWLAARDAQMRAEGIRQAREAVAGVLRESIDGQPTGREAVRSIDAAIDALAEEANRG